MHKGYTGRVIRCGAGIQPSTVVSDETASLTIQRSGLGVHGFRYYWCVHWNNDVRKMTLWTRTRESGCVRGRTWKKNVSRGCHWRCQITMKNAIGLIRTGWLVLFYDERVFHAVILQTSKGRLSAFGSNSRWEWDLGTRNENAVCECRTRLLALVWLKVGNSGSFLRSSTNQAAPQA